MSESCRTAAVRSSSSLPAVDRGALRQLEEQLGRDSLAELVTMFLQCTPDRLASLRHAAGSDDPAALREEAHSLKGTARSFGAAEMGEIAACIENGSAAGSIDHAAELVDALTASFERTCSELDEQLGFVRR